MSADLTILADLAGQGLALLVAVLLLGGVIYLQWYEYRRTWTHGVGKYWLIKLGTPAIVIGVVLATYLFAAGVSGMEALGIFYMGLLASLIASPLIVAQLARLADVPAKDALRLSVSVVALLLVGWFAGNMMVGSAVNLAGTDYSKRKAYLEMQAAERDAPPATHEVRLVERTQLRLPDGRRFIHLSFAVAPGYGLRSQAMKVERNWGREDDFFRGTLGGCFTPGHYHMTNVLDAAEEVTVRVVVQDGASATMRSLEQTFSFPDDPAAIDGFFQVFWYNGLLTLPAPLVARRIYLPDADNAPLLGLLPAAEDGGLPGSHARGRCAPLEMLMERQPLAIELYSEERYEHLRYALTPREVEPAYR